MKDEFDSIFSGEYDNEPDDLTETPTTDETIDPVETNVEDVVEAGPETVEADTTIETEKKPHNVPLGTFLDTRDKYKEEKRRADEAERQLADYRQQNQAPASVIDPYDDPAGFQASIKADFEARLTEQKLNFSRANAAEKHGEETTQAAIKWAAERANSDPAFEQFAVAQNNPVQWLIDQHKRHTELNDFDTDREAFIRREAARLGLGNAESSVVSNTNPDGIRNTAPKSLATVTSATKHTKETDNVDTFNSIFDRKR